MAPTSSASGPTPRPVRGLWTLTNVQPDGDRRLVRVLTAILLIGYVAIAGARGITTPVLLVPRALLALLVLYGFLCARRFSWLELRLFSVVIAVALPAITLFVNGYDGLTANDNLFVSLSILVPTVFLQTSRDMLVTVTLQVVTLAGVQAGIAEGSVPPGTAWLYWLGTILTAVALNLTLLASRGRMFLAQKDVARARDEALQAAELKSQFLANMSHEIRTPMNAIIGMADLLVRGQLHADEHRQAELLRSSARSLLRLLDDILDVSKIEAGRLELESHPMDLRRTIESTIAVLRLQAEEKDLELVVHLPDDVPVVRGDPLRIRQILVNLVGNAIKFTDEGLVELALRTTPAHRPQGEHLAEDCVGIELQVRDTGIGMDSQQRQHVFGAFHQGDGSIGRRYGGTGLGLTITSHLVSMMHGRIDVESVPGSGSCFTVHLELPRADPEEAAPSNGQEPAPESGAEGGRILVVDDQRTNRLLLRFLLQDAGYEVVEACNGVEAVEAVAQESFAACIMDVRMPQLDGLEATRRIRAQEVGAQHLPIIALTAHAMAGDRERCLAAGMDDYLSKPVEATALFGVLKRLAVEESSGKHQALPAPAKPPDVSSYLRRVFRDQRSLEHFVQVFRDTCTRHHAEIGLAVEEQRWDDAADIAHAAVGVCGNLGATELQELWRALETELRGARPDGVGERIAEARVEYHRVLEVAETVCSTWSGT